MSEQLGKDAGMPKWFQMSRAIELHINADKKLNANVDFYSASTYAPWASTSISTRPSSHQPHRRLGRPCHRAARRQPPHPPPRRVHRPAYPSPYIPIEERG